MKIDIRLQNSLRIRKQMPAEEIIAMATSFILKNTPKEYHSRIKEKINSLTFRIQSDMTSSEYAYEENTIYINPNHLTDINVYLHEMMHAVGTTIYDDHINIGLNLRKIVDLNSINQFQKNFGYGANEGLNQHYTEKFLPNDILKSQVSTSYSFCCNLMSSLEKLVGEKDCKIAHFSGEGILYLIEKIVSSCHLPNDNKAVKFILQLDAYQKIANTHIAFGADYSTDARMMLTECYKSLISLALIKAKAEGRDLMLTQVIINEHIEGDNFKYLTDYMLTDLSAYFYAEKQYVNTEHKHFVGMTYEKFEYYTNLMLSHYHRTNKIMDGKYIPEEVKCGEFYNNLLLSCMFYEQNSSMGLFSNDFQRDLTVAIFDKSKNLMPNKLSEEAQLIKHILASKNVVRSGAEISDECIIDSCRDEDFCLFLIDTMPDYFRTIFDKLCDDVKNNVNVMKKVITEVYKSSMDKYRLAKTLPKELLQNEEIKKLFIIKVNGTEKDLTK